MRVLINLILLAGTALASPWTYHVLSEDAGAWPEILGSVGFQAAPAPRAGIHVLRAGAPGSPQWPSRVESGAVLILEGESAVAEAFGFHKGGENARITSVTDVHRPGLPIVWQTAQDLPRFEIP